MLFSTTALPAVVPAQQVDIRLLRPISIDGSGVPPLALAEVEAVGPVTVGCVVLLDEVLDVPLRHNRLAHLWRMPAYEDGDGGHNRSNRATATGGVRALRRGFRR
jgi:hypothetical protein